jgi:hypothetical protein
VEEIYSPFTSKDFLFRPLDMIAGFQLVQRGEGYRYTPSNLNVSSNEGAADYYITKIGCYTYQVEAEIKQFWPEKDAYKKSFGSRGPYLGDSHFFGLKEWREEGT